MNTIGISWYCIYISLLCVSTYLQSKWYRYDKMSILAFLLLFDTATGVYKSYSLWSVSDKKQYDNWKHKNTWFNSTMFKVWIIWKIMTLILPIAVFSFISLIGYDISKLSTILVALIGWAELISILQNLTIARTKKPIQEFDAITFVMHWILEITKERITRTLTVTKYKEEDS